METDAHTHISVGQLARPRRTHISKSAETSRSSSASCQILSTFASLPSKSLLLSLQNIIYCPSSSPCLTADFKYISACAWKRFTLTFLVWLKVSWGYLDFVLWLKRKGGGRGRRGVRREERGYQKSPSADFQAPLTPCTDQLASRNCKIQNTKTQKYKYILLRPVDSNANCACNQDWKPQTLIPKCVLTSLP